MCGRYVVNTPGNQIAQAVGATEAEAPEVAPSFNIPPGTQQWVARTDATGNAVFNQLWWGYRPIWADDKAPRPINARAEKVAASPFFRDAFARYRCVIPATGWYEWQSHAGKKQPYYISIDTGLMLFAGIYDPPREDSEGCFAIITQPAAPSIAQIHPRMPVVLDPECVKGWLDPERQTRDEIKATTRAIDSAALLAWPVGPRVNRPANDDSELLKEISL